MAKMFYTLDEAKTALGRNEEEIKQLSREGRLREFRDGSRLMFKADQVDALKHELEGGSDHIDLGPSDSGVAIGLADSQSSGGTGHGLTLADSDGGRSPGAGMTLKEDTALAADLGLSGSIGDMSSPGGSATGSQTGMSATGSRAGIDVFHGDEVDHVDPSAQTEISPGLSEQSVEGVGSGSGLLDLTRESDDTSLGAELLDEIAPGPGGTGAGRRAAGDTGIGGSIAGGSMAGADRGAAAMGTVFRSAPISTPVVLREAPDPLAPAFAGAALGATVVVLFGAFAIISGLLGAFPDLMKSVAGYSFLILCGGGLALSVILFVVGLLVGRVASR